MVFNVDSCINNIFHSPAQLDKFINLLGDGAHQNVIILVDSYFMFVNLISDMHN